MQGISSEQFIIQTLVEKTSSFQPSTPTDSTSPTGLIEKEGILVFVTESLAHIDFDALIAQSREASDWESVNL